MKPWFESKVYGSDAAPETVQVVTRMVFGVWFFIVLTAHTQFISQFPISLFNPVGFLKIFSERAYLFLFQEDTFSVLRAVTLFALGCATLGWFPFPAAVVSCLLLTLLEGIYRGFSGHVNHTNLAFLYAAYFVTLFPLVDRLKRDQKRKTAGAPYVAVIGFMLLTYTMTGIYRLVHGRLDVFLNDTITSWVLQNSFSTEKGLWQLGKLLLDQEWLRFLFNLGFPIITLFEVLAPLCLVSKPFRIAFLLVMVPFHIFSWFFLKVFFWHNLILFVLLLDFDRFIRQGFKIKHLRRFGPV